MLRDPCGTFYPQVRHAGIRNAQHRARLLPIQNEVRLREQAADIGARVMPRHRVIGVPK